MCLLTYNTSAVSEAGQLEKSAGGKLEVGEHGRVKITAGARGEQFPGLWYLPIDTELIIVPT